MRVLMISKALVVGAYQRKAEELARLGLELMVVVPPSWIQEGSPLPLEPKFLTGYRLEVEPIAFNGHFHVHFYPRLARRFAQFRPDLVHIDEEAYNLATFQALLLARRFRSQSVFFTWQNLDRRYPWPFSAMERYVLRHAGGCIAGNQEAARIQRRRGFERDIAVIPQFGIDAELFIRRPVDRPAGFVIGFAGRLVEQKGLRVLCDAFETLPGDCHLLLAGSGPLEAEIRERAASRGWAGRLTIAAVSSTSMPEVYSQMDCLALPSLTTPAWKEQFGRAAVEAMACEVPVVGSDSGEIRQVVGDAGIVVPEGDPVALSAALNRLHDQPDLRRDLAALGRRRAVSTFTQAEVAAQTFEAYRAIMSCAK